MQENPCLERVRGLYLSASGWSDPLWRTFVTMQREIEGEEMKRIKERELEPLTGEEDRSLGRTLRRCFGADSATARPCAYVIVCVCVSGCVFHGDYKLGDTINDVI